MAKPKVLFLDDSPTMLAQASLLLGDRFAVDTCSDWVDANRRVHRDPPDLVVVDWQLGDFEGTHLVRAFRMFFGDGLPIVLISSDEAGVTAAKEARASAFVLKRDLARLPHLLEALHANRTR